MAPDPDESDLLDKKVTNIIQYIVGTMIYYSRPVDPTMLQAINEILRVKSRPTWDMMEKARMLLDYAAMYLNAILYYKASDMVLHVDSDAAHFAMLEAKSFYAGRFYLNDWPSPRAIKPNPKKTAPYTRSVKQSEILCPIQEKLKYVAHSTTGKAINKLPG